MARLSVWRAALIVLWCLAPGTANAGPPFRTDDPVPVEFGHYEFYTFSTGTIASKDKSGALPSFELNYGLIPNGQLTIDAPVAFDSPSGGPTRFGYGDTDLSFKYRFIQEDKEGSRPQVAVFPLVQLPKGMKTVGSGQAMSSRFFRSGFRRALAIGPPMGAAVIGSTKAASVTRTIGFLAGYSSGRSRTNSL
jgi:hypothetical protein